MNYVVDFTTSSLSTFNAQCLNMFLSELLLLFICILYDTLQKLELILCNKLVTIFITLKGLKKHK